MMYYVEMKDDDGKYVPLGILTLREAITISWECGHRAIHTKKVG
jgi:hypothetical protein